MTDRDFAIYHAGDVTLVCLASGNKEENAACSGIIGVGHSLDAAKNDWRCQLGARMRSLDYLAARMDV